MAALPEQEAEQAVPPEREAELAVGALWPLLEHQLLGRELGASSEPLAEAGPAGCGTCDTRGCGAGCSSPSAQAVATPQHPGEIPSTGSLLQNECLGAQKWAIQREGLHPEAIKMEDV